MKKFLFLFCFILTGCFQVTSVNDEDDDLRTVPVTNNPHVVPSHGNSLPGMPSGFSR